MPIWTRMPPVSAGGVLYRPGLLYRPWGLLHRLEDFLYQPEIPLYRPKSFMNTQDYIICQPEPPYIGQRTSCVGQKGILCRQEPLPYQEKGPPCRKWASYTNQSVSGIGPRAPTSVKGRLLCRQEGLLYRSGGLLYWSEDLLSQGTFYIG